MTGVSRVNGVPLAPPPSNFQGFGRLDLAGSLPLAGDARGWRLQIVDSAIFTAAGQEHAYTLTVPAASSGAAARPLVAALVWHDFPAFPASKYVLVNDLDLLVKAPNSEDWWGNGREGGDYHNNVEKVKLTSGVAFAPTSGLAIAFLLASAILVYAPPLFSVYTRRW
jgi:hypothetical protein